MGRKRFLALVMALTMLFTLMAPALTFATGTGSEEETPGAGISEVTEETNEQGSDTDPDEGDGAGNDAVDTNTGADNTGDTGDTDTGDVDTGDVDTGADNTGDTGTGDAGADNTGDTGTGDSDTGDVDTGDVDTGDTDTGDTDTGADNTGDTGDTGTGDSDTGDTDTGDVDTGDVDTGADENTDAAQDSGKTLPPATVPGDGDGEGDGEGDADKGGDQLLSDGDLGEEEVEKTRGTTEPTTITVAIISYVNRNRGTTGWTVHYWDDASNGGDAPCSLTNPQTVVKHSLDGYWENAPKDFLVYTATIPADVTGYEIHKDGNKINTDFNTDLSNKGVYVFEYGDVYHTQFVESIGYTLGAITVYYKTTWGQPRVHYWFTDGGSVDFGGTTWPGVYMTPVQNQENKFKATIPANVGGLLFNNGSGDQTVDIRNGIENGAFWRPNGNSDTSGHLYVESANITVTFDLNEGNIGDDTNKVEVTIQEGDCVSAPNPAPTKAGCRFIGWSLSNNNELFNFEQGLYTNAILYAQYKQLYTVTAGAGEVENGTVTADKTQAVEGETVTLTVTPAEGFALKSMTVTGDDGVVPVENNSFIMPASDVTVTATFSPIVAKIGDTGYETLQAAINAAQAGDTVILLKDATIEQSDTTRFPISKSITIDGAGHTININNRGFGVGVGASEKIDVTFKDVTILNSSSGARCIDTRGNIGTLTLDHVTLNTQGAPSGSTQPLTIGGNQSSAATVIIKNGSVIQTNEDGTAYYAIITFNPVNMTIDQSTIKGWACIYAKGPDGSAGSADSVFNITNSTLVSNNVYPGVSNAFGMLMAEDNNVTFNITNSSINVNAAGDQPQAIISTKDKTITNVIANLGAGNNVTLTGEKAVFELNNGKAVVTGGTFNHAIPAAYCADGYIPQDLGGGLYSVQEGATITFENYDGTELLTLNVAQGGTVAYTGEDPAKAADANGVYTWSGWSDGNNTYSTTDTLSAATTADVTYTATFSSVNNVASVTDTNNNVTYYTSLPDAIAAAQDGDTITLLVSTTGAGLFIGPSKFTSSGLTIDFNGKTYTVETPVGSSGTVNQALHFEQGNKITLTGGTIDMTNDSSKLAAFDMVMQNYGTLVIYDMTIDGTGIAVKTYGSNYSAPWGGSAKPQFNYNTAGSSVIRNSTITVVGDIGIDDAAGLTIEDDATINANKIVTKDTDERYASATPTVTVENGATFKLADFDSFDALLGENAQAFGDIDANGYRKVETLKVAQIVRGAETLKYETLAEAIAEVGSGETIKMIADESGAKGMSVPSGKNFTVDFDNHTYTVSKPGAGSSNTETNAFQLLTGSTIVFKNGTIAIAEDNLTPAVAPAKNIMRVIQNYANLTLDHMVIDSTNQYGGNEYPVSFNNGTSVIEDTTITAGEGMVAFDVCRYASYPSVSVTVTGDSEINGNVEVSASNSDPKDGFSLTLTSGTLNGDIVVDATAKTAIMGTPDKAEVTKDDDFTQAAPEGFIWESNGDGTSSLVVDYWTVTFNLNGGIYNNSQDNVEVKVEKGTTVAALVPNPTYVSNNENKYFGGWFTDVTGNVEFDFSEAITDDITLYAKWETTSVYCTVSLALKDCIDFNIYVKGVPEADKDKYSLRYSFNSGSEQIVPVTSLEKKNSGYFCTVAHVAAKHMTKEIRFEVLCNETVVYSETEPWSIKRYCDFVLDNYNDAKLTELCQAVLDYGTYAQIRFNDTSVHANTTHCRDTDIITNWSNEATEDLAKYKTSEYMELVSGAQWVGNITCSLSLESRTEMKFYIGLNDSYSSDTYSIVLTVGDEAWTNYTTETTQIQGQTKLCLTVKGIPASRLGDVIQITATDSTSGGELVFKYTPMTYVAIEAANTTDNGNVCRALYYYFKAASAYFNN